MRDNERLLAALRKAVENKPDIEIHALGNCLEI